MNNKGFTVGTADNFFGNSAVFNQLSLSDLKLKLGFKETTPLGRYKILYSIYDELSALRLDFDVELVSSDLPLEVTNMIYTSDFYFIYNSASSGTNLPKLETKLDILKGY
jgi:hypothetical protein